MGFLAADLGCGCRHVRTPEFAIDAGACPIRALEQKLWKIAMTTPSERVRAIRLGAELLACIQADGGMAPQDRERALTSSTAIRMRRSGRWTPRCRRHRPLRAKRKSSSRPAFCSSRWRGPIAWVATPQACGSRSCGTFRGRRTDATTQSRSAACSTRIPFSCQPTLPRTANGKATLERRRASDPVRQLRNRDSYVWHTRPGEPLCPRSAGPAPIPRIRTGPARQATLRAVAEGTTRQGRSEAESTFWLSRRRAVLGVRRFRLQFGADGFL